MLEQSCLVRLCPSRISKPSINISAGLNRGHDNISNTIAAAKVAKADMGNLLAIELGNEPECE